MVYLNVPEPFLYTCPYKCTKHSLNDSACSLLNYLSYISEENTKGVSTINDIESNRLLMYFYSNRLLTHLMD